MENIDPQESQDSAAPSRTGYSRFSEEELVYLCQAYVNVSEDPVRGTDQRVDEFWDAVYNKFLKMCKLKCLPRILAQAEKKKSSSLKNKFRRDIMPDMNHFLGIMKRHPLASGENEEDQRKRCLEIFEKQYQKKFLFSSCVEILKNMPKFSVDTGANDVLVNSQVYNSVKTPRPIGTKGAKRIINEQGQKEESIAKIQKTLDDIAQSARALSFSSQVDSAMALYNAFNSRGEHRQAYAFLLKAVAFASGTEPAVHSNTAEVFSTPEQVVIDGNNEESEDDRSTALVNLQEVNEVNNFIQDMNKGA